VTSTDIVPAGDDLSDLMVGLEDFDENDIVLPTIKIDHKTGNFVDGLTQEKMEVLDCVVLGLIKGRTMWSPEVKDDEPPLCRSLNFSDGRPGEKFPWDKAGFPKPGDTEGCTVSCDACPLKEWGSHPKRDTVPWCSEQHTYVIGLAVNGGASYAPAIITFQGSGIKPSKAYLSGFVRAKSPTFVARTRIRLDQLKRGSVDYCVPVFEKGEPIDESFFGGFAAQFRSIRTFLHTPRAFKEEDAVSEGAAPAPKAAPTKSYDDDEMPF
jgi:hypothetical protein